MVQAGVRKILNDVIDGDSVINYHNIETVTDMYPGALVIKGTTDYDIAACGAAGITTGWLGYGSCNGNDKPDTRDTIYLVSAEAPVHSKARYVRAIYATAADIAKGDPLKAAANGCVAIGTPGTDDIIAVAAESVLSGATRVWAESRI